MSSVPSVTAASIGIQNSDVPKVLRPFLSATDIQISEFSTSQFQHLSQAQAKEVSLALNHWEKAAQALELKKDSEDHSPGVKIKFYRTEIEAHFQKLNDAFDHKLKITENEIRGMDYNAQAIKAVMESIPKFEETGALSHAKHTDRLHEFIHTNKHAQLFDPLLFQALDDHSLLKMLLDEGVEPSPAPIEEFEEEAKFDQESLAWVSLLQAKPYWHTDVEFCTLILQHHKIDEQGLTYLLWLSCQTDIGEEDERLAVMKFLVSQGATWDPDLINDYPPITLTNEEKPLKFMTEQVQAQAKILTYVNSQLLC